MKLEYMLKAIKNSKHLVCLVGMEMLRERGYSYYKDDDQLYETEKKYGYSPEELYNVHCFNTRPELFYEYYKNEVLSQEPSPGPGNEALARLEQMGYARCFITKGIHYLLQKAGCKNVINLHGNIYENNRCPRCGKIYPIEYIKETEGIPLCEKCNIPIHPGGILHGEMVDNFLMSTAAEEVSKADVLLVVGMDLKASLCRELLPYFNGARLILVNRREHYSDNVADLVYHEPVEEIMPEAVRVLESGGTPPHSGYRLQREF